MNSDSNSGEPHNLDSNSGEPHNLDSNSGEPHNLDSNSDEPHNLDSNSGEPHNLDSNSDEPHNLDSNSGEPHNLDSSSGEPHNLDRMSGEPHQNHGDSSDEPSHNPVYNKSLQLHHDSESHPCQKQHDSESHPCHIHPDSESHPCTSRQSCQCCECTRHSLLPPHEPSWEEHVTKEVIQRWDREQSEYKERLITEDTEVIATWLSAIPEAENGKELYIGGADISFIKGNSVDACSCLTIIRASDFEVVYQRIEMIQLTQPYVPGYLAFREVQPLIDQYNQLRVAAPHYLPDVIMVDGNGALHPRGFGLACHLGVVLEVPTLGVAKTLISAQGIHDDPDHKLKKQTLKQAGDFFDLVSDSGTVLGRCVRTCNKAPNPIYISVGHKITLESATQICLRCSKYRIPEPVRKADIDSREYLRQNKKEPFEFIKE